MEIVVYEVVFLAVAVVACFIGTHQLTQAPPLERKEDKG